MGMFDRLYDESGNEWQTKAYGCNLDLYRIGDRIGPPPSYQVQVLGGPGDGLADSYATVRDGVLASVPAERDPSLPLLDYYGALVATEEG